MSKSVAVFALDLHSAPDVLRKGLELCARCAEETMIFSPRDELGLLLCGTANTCNPLFDSTNGARGGHLTLVAPIAPPTASSFLRPLRRLGPEAVQPAHKVDFIESITLCVCLLRERAGRRRCRRAVYLLTDAQTAVTRKTDAAPLLESLRTDAIDLVVMGIDAEPSPAHSRNDETDESEVPEAAQNARVLRHLCAALGEGSLIASVDDVLAGLAPNSRRRVARQAVLRAALDIGGVRIAAQLVTKTKAECPPRLKRAAAPSTHPRGEESSPFHSKLFPTCAANGERDESPRRAYRYGRTLVPCSAADLAAMRVGDAPRVLEALATVPRASVAVPLLFGGARTLRPLAHDTDGARALRAISIALSLTQRALILRVVSRRGARPTLAAMTASVRGNGLHLCGVPFFEDRRPAPRPPPSPTAEGAEDKESMAQLVDQLVEDLTVDADQLRLRETVNPTMEAFYEALRAGLRGDAEMPVTSSGKDDPMAVVKRWEGLLESVMQRAKGSLEALTNALPPDAPSSLTEEVIHTNRCMTRGPSFPRPEMNDEVMTEGTN